MLCATEYRISEQFSIQFHFDDDEQCLSRKLIEGDIINVDVTVFLDGFHGDTSKTFLVGDVVSRK